jgi:hypothetical protein
MEIELVVYSLDQYETVRLLGYETGLKSQIYNLGNSLLSAAANLLILILVSKLTRHKDAQQS